MAAHGSQQSADAATLPHVLRSRCARTPARFASMLKVAWCLPCWHSGARPAVVLAPPDPARPQQCAGRAQGNQRGPAAMLSTRAVVCQRSVHRTVLRAIQRAAVSNRSVSRRCWRTSTCRRRVCARLARSVRATYTAEALGIQRACRRRVCTRVLGEIRSKPTACGRPPLAVGLGTHGSVPPCASGRPPLLAWLRLLL
jgi:hypothetical protein